MANKNKYVFGMILVLVLIVLQTHTAFSARVPWQKDVLYSHYAQNENLKELLGDFCASQGLKLILDQDISGVVSGHFQDQDPEQFFEGITSTYSLFWYYDGTIMYVYPADKLQTRIISVDYLTTDRLVTILKELGIADERFPIRSVASEKILYLSGPERFVELATLTAEKLDEKAKKNATAPPAEIVIRSFSLQYAWAADLSFTFMDGEVIVPGIATILNNLISGNPTPVSINKQERLKKTVDKLKGTGLAKNQSKDNSPDKPAAVSDDNTIRSYVQADLRNNSVIVRDLADKMSSYEEIIKVLDVPVGLVEIRVAIIDVSKGLGKELGVDWRLNLGQDHNDIRIRSGFNADANLTAGNTELGTGSGLNFTTIIGNAEEYFLTRIRALEESNDAKILSEPSIVTLNNIEASIEHNSTIHIRLEGTDEVDLFEVSAGVVLRVTPHIIRQKDKNLLKLVVKIKDGSFLETTVDNIPEILNSTINTQAVVAEGESLLIGGYTKERKKIVESKVPLLGDIPGLGVLFRAETKGTEQAERLFLITPRIITKSYSGKGDAELSKWRSNYIVNEDTRRYLEDILNRKISPPVNQRDDRTKEKEN